MRQPDHEYEERSFGDIQRAIDFENSMNDLESQLYYQHLSPKEVAQQVLKATCQFYVTDHLNGGSVFVLLLIGGEYRDRTGDLLHAMQALSRTTHSRTPPRKGARMSNISR